MICMLNDLFGGAPVLTNYYAKKVVLGNLELLNFAVRLLNCFWETFEEIMITC